MPKAPPGCGPVLESHVVTGRTVWAGGVFTFLLLIVLLVLLRGVSWAGVWWMWPLIAAPAAAVGFTIRGSYCAAGADWLRTRGGWVELYELTEISMHVNGSSVDLFREDRHRRGLTAQIDLLQANGRLWDLVHNGLRHSAAGGAEVNAYARRALSLPAR